MNCAFKQNKAALLGNNLFTGFFFFFNGDHRGAATVPFTFRAQKGHPILTTTEAMTSWKPLVSGLNQLTFQFKSFSSCNTLISDANR